MWSYCVIYEYIDSRPHGKPLDKLAEDQDINDPIYQMQRDAFTIQKEALTDFRVIGKGLSVCLSVSTIRVLLTHCLKYIAHNLSDILSERIFN